MSRNIVILSSLFLVTVFLFSSVLTVSVSAQEVACPPTNFSETSETNVYWTTDYSGDHDYDTEANAALERCRSSECPKPQVTESSISECKNYCNSQERCEYKNAYTETEVSCNKETRRVVIDTGIMGKIIRNLPKINKICESGIQCDCKEPEPTIATRCIEGCSPLGSSCKTQPNLLDSGGKSGICKIDLLIGGPYQNLDDKYFAYKCSCKEEKKNGTSGDTGDSSPGDSTGEGDEVGAAGGFDIFRFFAGFFRGVSDTVNKALAVIIGGPAANKNPGSNTSTDSATFRKPFACRAECTPQPPNSSDVGYVDPCDSECPCIPTNDLNNNLGGVCGGEKSNSDNIEIPVLIGGSSTTGTTDCSAKAKSCSKETTTNLIIDISTASTTSDDSTSTSTDDTSSTSDHSASSTYVTTSFSLTTEDFDVMIGRTKAATEKNPDNPNPVGSNLMQNMNSGVSARIKNGVANPHSETGGAFPLMVAGKQVYYYLEEITGPANPLAGETVADTSSATDFDGDKNSVPGKYIIQFYFNDDSYKDGTIHKYSVQNGDFHLEKSKLANESNSGSNWNYGYYAFFDKPGSDSDIYVYEKNGKYLPYALVPSYHTANTVTVKLKNTETGAIVEKPSRIYLITNEAYLSQTSEGYTAYVASDQTDQDVLFLDLHDNSPVVYETGISGLTFTVTSDVTYDKATDTYSGDYTKFTFWIADVEVGHITATTGPNGTPVLTLSSEGTWSTVNNGQVVATKNTTDGSVEILNLVPNGTAPAQPTADVSFTLNQKIKDILVYVEGFNAKELLKFINSQQPDIYTVPDSSSLKDGESQTFSIGGKNYTIKAVKKGNNLEIELYKNGSKISSGTNLTINLSGSSFKFTVIDKIKDIIKAAKEGRQILISQNSGIAKALERMGYKLEDGKYNYNSSELASLLQSLVDSAASNANASLSGNLVSGKSLLNIFGPLGSLSGQLVGVSFQDCPLGKGKGIFYVIGSSVVGDSCLTSLLPGGEGGETPS